MSFEPYIGQILVALAATISGWLVGRRKQQADTKKVEVEVLERALQVLEKDVVEPLRNNMNKVQDDYLKLHENYKKVLIKLNRLQDAITEMYGCPHLSICPIRRKLSKHKSRDDERDQREHPANRQREPP